MAQFDGVSASTFYDGRPPVNALDHPGAAVIEDPRAILARLTTGGFQPPTPPPGLMKVVKAVLEAAIPASATGSAAYSVISQETKAYRKYQPIGHAMPASVPTSGLINRYFHCAGGSALSARTFGGPLAWQKLFVDQAGPDQSETGKLYRAMAIGPLSSPLIHIVRMTGALSPSHSVHKPLIYQHLLDVIAKKDFVPFRCTLLRQTAISTSFLGLTPDADRRKQLMKNGGLAVLLTAAHDLYSPHRNEIPLHLRLGFGTLRWTLLQTVFQEANKLIKS